MATQIHDDDSAPPAGKKAFALIFAGGVGRRMHSSAMPKQFLELYGKPVIVRTLEIFEAHPEVEGIAVACVADWIDHLRGLVAKFGLRKVRAIVPGGATGRLSIRAGLRAIADLGVPAGTLILVHDGVRPLVTAGDIAANLAAARRFGGAVTVAPAYETIAVVDDAGRVGSLVPRETCRLVRAPQTFRLGDMLQAHAQADALGRDEVIDTLTLMRDAGFPPPVAVEGAVDNIKITTPQDFMLFKQLVEAREEQRAWDL